MLELELEVALVLDVATTGPPITLTAVADAWVAVVDVETAGGVEVVDVETGVVEVDEEVDVEDEEDEDEDEVEVEVVEVDFEVVLADDTEVTDLRTAVHRTPFMDVIAAPAGRFALV